MTAPMLRPTGQAAAQTELLSQLGLPASASPEDVDQLHQAVSDFLAAAPPEIRGWARAQVAALDSAYLTLTDPAGLEGSALMSPASPPAVVPGGPATPPARRGLDVEEAASPASPDAAPVDTTATTATTAIDALDDLEIDDEPDVEDLAALYAAVTPSAHADMAPDAARLRTKKQRREARAAAATPLAAPPSAPNWWKRVALGGAAVIAIFAVGFGANSLVNGGGSGAPAASQVAQASSGVPSVDLNKISGLMATLNEKPDDIETLLALGNEYYNGQEFETAANWFDKVLAVDPEHVEGLLARGAVYFNTGDSVSAEKLWKQVVGIDPDNVEAHYDLGFLYLNSATPNWDGLRAEWNKVIELDPDSELAKTVQAHLDQLVMASMLPAEGASPGASAAPGASAVPSGSPAANASPAAGATVVEQSALSLAFAKAQLTAPADAPFTIRFENKEALPHDIQILDATGKVVFKGDLVTGPKSVDYAVPALAAGTYTFSCSIHPNMTGTLTVEG
jgi:tetratricopeptide (TPR) repeat protein